MIDLHCHLIPSIDDGPRSSVECVNLARLLVDDNIERVVCTPHVYPGRFNNNKVFIDAGLSAVLILLREFQINLAVSAGAEVRLTAELFDMIDADEIPFIGCHNGRKVMLLEFPNDIIPAGADKALSALQSRGVCAMIAHPERNLTLAKKPERVLQFLEHGCILQITASSVLGEFGRSAMVAAHRMIENGWAFVISSDAHNTSNRRPAMSKARMFVEDRWGSSLAEALTKTNPSSILGAI